MPITPEQQACIDKAKEFKEIMDRERNEALTHAQTLAGIEQQKGRAALNKRTHDAHPSWERARKSAHDLYVNPHAGHDTFASTYSKLMSLYAETTGALYMQVPVLLTRAHNMVAPSVKDLDGLVKRGLGIEKSPGIKYINVSVDDATNELKLDLTRTDDKAVAPELLETFRGVVVAWLITKGYTLQDDTDGVFANERGGEPLTSERLKQLGPERELPMYLQALKVKFNPSISPSPRP